MTRCGAHDYLAALRRLTETACRSPLLAPHQSDAAGRLIKMLSRRPGAILADDVGLGKSYAAAAVMAAMARDGYEITLIVPAMLRAQWMETTSQFHVVASIVSHDQIRSDPRLPSPGTRRLLVIDEAHRFRNPATARYEALARQAIGARCLLITATPICNRIEDLRALIDLIAADDSLAAAGVPSLSTAFDGFDAGLIAVIVRELVIRRGRGAVSESLRFGALKRNVVSYCVDRGGELYAAIGALTFPTIEADATRSLLRRFLWRRLESSPAALTDSVDRQLRFYRRALAARRDGREISKSLYRTAFATDDEGPMQEVLFWDLWLPRTGEAASVGNDLAGEVDRLHALRCAGAGAIDEKVARLRDLLNENEPILIFTCAVATARAIYGVIASLRRTALLTSRGGVDAYRRVISPDQALALFTSGAVDILVCTDMAGEGLNLQRAGLVVHYDLPWNPVKLDQRNGRVHRIGQTREEVRAIYFLPERSGADSGVVETIARKNRLRRRTLKSETCSDADIGAVIGTQLVVDGECPTIALVEFGSIKLLVEGRRTGSDVLERIEGEIHPLDSAAFDAFLRRTDRMTVTRSLLRPHVADSSPQKKLALALTKERFLDARGKQLLAARYRVGVERLIALTVRGYLDETRRDELYAVLDAERRLEATATTRPGRVVAGIVGKGAADASGASSMPEGVT